MKMRRYLKSLIFVLVPISSVPLSLSAAPIQYLGEYDIDGSCSHSAPFGILKEGIVYSFCHDRTLRVISPTGKVLSSRKIQSSGGDDIVVLPDGTFLNSERTDQNNLLIVRYDSQLQILSKVQAPEIFHGLLSLPDGRFFATSFWTGIGQFLQLGHPSKWSKPTGFEYGILGPVALENGIAVRTVPEREGKPGHFFHFMDWTGKILTRLAPQKIPQIYGEMFRYSPSSIVYQANDYRTIAAVEFAGARTRARTGISTLFQLPQEATLKEYLASSKRFLFKTQKEVVLTGTEGRPQGAFTIEQQNESIGFVGTVGEIIVVATSYCAPFCRAHRLYFLNAEPGFQGRLTVIQAFNGLGDQFKAFRMIGKDHMVGITAFDRIKFFRLGARVR
jgi:hypothetical protein